MNAPDNLRSNGWSEKCPARALRELKAEWAKSASQTRKTFAKAHAAVKRKSK